jgi:hypothetical protein
MTLRTLRFALILIAVGGVLTLIGGGAYLKTEATWATITMITGVPLLVGGLGLQAAELAPAPLLAEATPEAIALRSGATPTQRQIFQDATRYQYGLEAHLEPALERLGLKGENEDEEEVWPTMLGIQEAAIEGAYAIIMHFGSLEVPYEAWQAKEAQMTQFFGPDIVAQTEKLSDKKVQVTLVSTRSAAS